MNNDNNTKENENNIDSVRSEFIKDIITNLSTLNDKAITVGENVVILELINRLHEILGFDEKKTDEIIIE